MKSRLIRNGWIPAVAVFFTCASALTAANRVVAPQIAAPNQNEAQGTILARTANERKWQGVATKTNELGAVTVQPTTFTEIATGLHYRGEDGTWKDSEEALE